MDRDILLDESFGLLGMVQEIGAKVALLRNRAAQQDPLLLDEDVIGKLEEMHEELGTYSDRLEEIYEELSEDGRISQFPGMGSEPSLN